MRTFLVGDIQGCFSELQALLQRVQFDANTDKLICVGDLVARGPDSKRVLDFAIALGDSFHTVLGNHDLHLLAILSNLRKPHPTDKLDAILASTNDERQRYVDWLRRQPLLLSNDEFTVTHAGIYPWWTLNQAQEYALEVTNELRSERYPQLLEAMYGNKPAIWDSSLRGYDRYRFIVNAFTRMRFCRADGSLDFTCKLPPSENTDLSLRPWFHWWPQHQHTVIFGHWAALNGHTSRTDVIGLDTGCVWGDTMTLLSWPERQFVIQPAGTFNSE